MKFSNPSNIFLSFLLFLLVNHHADLMRGVQAQEDGQCLVDQGRGCRSQWTNLGKDFTSPEECAVAAAENPGCGTTFMYSPRYGYAWGCRCCTKDDAGDGPLNSNWNLHSVKGCGATPPPEACSSMDQLNFDTRKNCKYNTLVRDIKQNIGEDCPHNKFVELEILTNNFGDRNASKEAIVDICSRGGPCVLEQGRACGRQYRNLGTSFGSPEECAAAAAATPGCGSAFMFSPTYGYAWGCRCCTSDGEKNGQHNGHWNLHSVRGCSPAPAPTAPPTLQACSTIEELEFEDIKDCTIKTILKRVVQTFEPCSHGKKKEIEILTDNIGNYDAAVTDIIDICESLRIDASQYACSSLEELQLETLTDCNVTTILKRVGKTIDGDNDSDTPSSCEHSRGKEIQFLTDNVGNRDNAELAIIELCEEAHDN